MPAFTAIPSSFRDPSGFVFEQEGEIYRQVNQSYKEDFDALNSSGCYDRLVQQQLLLPHEVIANNFSGTPDCYLTLKPERLAYISYPYEWCFDMLKDAALLTLTIAKECMQHGMMLKDATPYNIQWHSNRLVFIDSLSFEKYDAAKPWVAYRQFCESFLAPLLLMHYKKYPLHQLFLAWPEGIPLPLTSSLLPYKTRFSLHIYLHIHLHAGMAGKKNTGDKKQAAFSKQKMLNLLGSLEGLINKLQLPAQNSTWSAYYEEAAQRDDYLPAKKTLVEEWVKAEKKIRTAIDLGANDGEFSKLLARKQINTIAADADPFCINNLYGRIKKEAIANVHPMILDLANPSPAIGVYNGERASFTARTSADLALALALIHHLAIGKNIPFDKIAAFFAQLCDTLIIEFVPKTDEKIQLMLSGREDIFSHYTAMDFEEAFSRYFHIQEQSPIASSGRILYRMKKHAD